MEDGAWQTHTHTDVQNEVHCIGIAVSGNTDNYLIICTDNVFSSSMLQ